MGEKLNSVSPTATRARKVSGTARHKKATQAEHWYSVSARNFCVVLALIMISVLSCKDVGYTPSSTLQTAQEIKTVLMQLNCKRMLC